MSTILKALRRLEEEDAKDPKPTATGVAGDSASVASGVLRERILEEEDAARATATELASAGVKAAAFRCDVSSFDEVDALGKAVAEELGDDVVGRTVDTALADRVHNALSRRIGHKDVAITEMRRNVIAAGFKRQPITLQQR